MQIISIFSVLGLALSVSSAAIEARQLADCNPQHNHELVWGNSNLCCNYNGPSDDMADCCDRELSTPSGAKYCGTHFAYPGCPRVMPYKREWAPEVHLCCNGLPEVRQTMLSTRRLLQRHRDDRAAM
ncbi:hypothetical protein ACHAQA_007790 [Verticillium albo-atrum]